MATEFVCSIKSSGGDYSTLSSWEAAIQCDLTSAATKVFGGSKTGTINDAASVTGSISEATGTVTHCTATQIHIKSISGTFQSGEQIQVDESNYFTTSNAGDSSIAVAECDNYEIQTTALTFSGWTAGSTNRIIVRPASGQERSSSNALNVNDGPRLNCGSGMYGIVLPEQYITIIGLSIYSGQSTLWGYWSGGTGNNHIIIEDVVACSHDYPRHTANLYDESSHFTFRNCVLYTTDGSHACIYTRDAGALVSCYNCTFAQIDKSASGYSCVIEASGCTVNLENCYASCMGYDSAYETDNSSWEGTFTNSASSDTTGSAGLQNLSAADQFVSVTSGSEDFKLKSQSEGCELIGQGVVGTG